MAVIFGKKASGETLDASDGVTNGSDVIIGNAGCDDIFGLGGNDVLKGGGGADDLYGGIGSDTATYEDSATAVNVDLTTGQGHWGSAEGDALFSVENLYGSSYGDWLIGNAQDNKLEGAGGNDVLKGGGGADTLIGGAGDDSMKADGVNDTFDGGDGIDTVSLLDAAQGMGVDMRTGHIGKGYPHGGGGWAPEIVNVENIIGSNHDDYVLGSDVDNELSGAGGADFLYGASGDDVLKGGAGDDRLIGSAGADTMRGDLGADEFEFWSAEDSFVVSGKPQDVIQDFKSGQDKIDLSNMSFELSDLLTLNTIVGAVYTSTIGIDANANGQCDNGEFAVAVQMQGANYLSSCDLIL